PGKAVPEVRIGEVLSDQGTAARSDRATVAERRGQAVALSIPSPQLVQSHAQRVEERRKPAYGADFRTRHIVPSHRHLDRGIAELARDEQHFHVEPETLEPLAAENLARSVSFE